MKEVTRDTLLGLVFFGALAILGYFTIVLTDFSFSEKQKLSVRFTAAQGLKPGDPVLVLGTRSGRVTGVQYDALTKQPERVLVTLQLETPVQLTEGFILKIEESSFLGGRMITIYPGEPNKPVINTKSELIGLVAESPLAELGKLVQENRDDFRQIVSNFRKVSDRAEKGEGTIGKLLVDDKLYHDMLSMVDNAKSITEDLKAGKGTLGRLLTDETLANNISTTVTNFGDLSKGLKDGKGSLGKLLNEDTLYNNLNEIVGDIRNGKGTIGKLIYDEAVASDVATSAKNLREITDSIAHGQGTLAKLLNDKELYDNINNSVLDFRSIVSDVKEGKGNLGKLIKDETLFNDIQTTFKSINRTIEDAREAAPISTFAGLLFSSF